MKYTELVCSIEGTRDCFVRSPNRRGFYVEKIRSLTKRGFIANKPLDEPFAGYPEVSPIICPVLVPARLLKGGEN